MNLRARAESIERALERPRAHPDKYEAAVSLIPSFSTPFSKHELQEGLKKANAAMAMLDAAGSQADTLLYAEERFFSLYENAVKEAPDTQLFLLLSPSTVQENALFTMFRQMNASDALLFSQLCAALRASAIGKLSLLLPFVTTQKEIDIARQMIGQAMRNLRMQGISFDETIPLGIVLGTPASLLLSRRLIEAVDLVMIDTDLLAALSLNSAPVSGDFENLLNESAEAILRLVEVGVGNAHLLGRFVMLSGDMVADSRFLPHFLAMGANALVAPSQKLKNLRSLLGKVR